MTADAKLEKQLDTGRLPDAWIEGVDEGSGTVFFYK